MKRRITPLFVGIIVITVITAVVTGYSGWYAGRWGSFKGIEEASDSIKTLPFKIEGAVGTWEASEDRKLGDQAVTMLKIQDSYVFRSYKNSVTMETVHLTLMVGASGRITVHTPDICFGGRDYDKEGPRTRVPFTIQSLTGDKEFGNTFWRTSFASRSLDERRISFYYGVTTGEVWEAVENPRSSFKRYRYVYKLQAEAYSGSDERGDAVKRFLEDCLPAIHACLRPCS